MLHLVIIMYIFLLCNVSYVLKNNINIRTYDKVLITLDFDPVHSYRYRTSCYMNLSVSYNCDPGY